MIACVLLDDRVCLGWFAVEQGLRQGWVLAPPVQHLLRGGTNVAYTRFKADKDTMDIFLVPRRKKTGVRARGEAAAGEPALATSLWSMLYADDAGVSRNRSSSRAF